MNISRPLILALDGHDGAGKTTLARWLAEELDAPYVYPFTGDRGSRILTSAEAGHHRQAQKLAKTLLQEALEQFQAEVLVFDRHWMTVFTLLPEEYWPSWQPLPATTLCWADLETTLGRLASRNEHAMPTSWHRHYVDLYLQLGQRFHCHVLTTHDRDQDEACHRLLNWARGEMEKK